MQNDWTLKAKAIKNKSNKLKHKCRKALIQGRPLIQGVGFPNCERLFQLIIKCIVRLQCDIVSMWKYHMLMFLPWTENLQIVEDKAIEIVINWRILFNVHPKWIICLKLSKIHPALLRKDNYFKTLPAGKLVKILTLV